MFAKSIVDSDLFLDMPATTQLLYFHLGMRADDDGFIVNPKSIMRAVACSHDDLVLLIEKGFVIKFDSGVIVIRHWKINNSIRGDRKTPTKCKEKSLIDMDNEDTYQICACQPNDNQVPTICQPDDSQSVSNLDTQDRIGKDRLGKDRLDSFYLARCENFSTSQQSFNKPMLKDVQAYAEAENIQTDVQRFYNYYEEHGWKDKKGRDVASRWKATLKRWGEQEGKYPEKRNPNDSHVDAEKSAAYKSLVYNPPDK